MLLVLLGLAHAADVVAVTYFDAHSIRPDLEPLGRGVADMLTTDLGSAPGLSLVERTRIAEVLTELGLGKGSFIDPTTAQKLGKGVGANLVVVGSLTVAIEGMRIDARVVDVATGQIRATSQATGKEDQFFALEDEVARELLAGLGVTATIEERPVELDRIVAVRLVRTTIYSGSWAVFEGGNTRLSTRDFAERTGDTEMLARLTRTRRSLAGWGWGTTAVSAAATGGGIALTAWGWDESVPDPVQGARIGGGITLDTLGLTGMLTGLTLGLVAPTAGADSVRFLYTPEDADTRIRAYNEALAARLGVSQADVLSLDLK
jgi:TolB-like protein